MHTLTQSGHAMSTLAGLNKYQVQRLCDEIVQRLAILQREGWDVSDALDNIRDINFALVEV